MPIAIGFFQRKSKTNAKTNAMLHLYIVNAIKICNLALPEQWIVVCEVN